MGRRISTLSDVLSLQQLQIVILHALGLDSWQIADLLETSRSAVYRCLADSLKRTGCSTREGLVVRLLFEWESHLCGEELNQALTKLQIAAKGMLERIELTDTSTTWAAPSGASSTGWVM
jgi:DNA-binding CsgD family transcriptional regulator